MARVPDAALALSTRALGGLKNAGTLLARTYLEWSEDHATQYGAAMAYYMFFSLAPLLILAVAFAGAFFGAEAAEVAFLEDAVVLIGQKPMRDRMVLLEVRVAVEEADHFAAVLQERRRGRRDDRVGRRGRSTGEHDSHALDGLAVAHVRASVRPA